MLSSNTVIAGGSGGVAMERSEPESFADEVRTGLLATPKTLPPKYFYDELGSHLFEAICALPEYYVARAESEILARYGTEMIDELRGPVRLIELGSGDAAKTHYIIEALLARQSALQYSPIDISSSALEASVGRLAEAFPGLRITPRNGDFERELELLGSDSSDGGSASTLVLFFGSTLGNLLPEVASRLLTRIRGSLDAGDALLIGLDLKKSDEVLIPAYDDALGVTAAFNLNLLVRINRELGGEFDLAGFRHCAVYDDELGRVEMRIESLVDQKVRIRDLDLIVTFSAGEWILSECSYKFDPEQVADLARNADFEPVRRWTDANGYFSSNLLRAV
jgi:L-histidine N-alpha-methyltransferase